MIGEAPDDEELKENKELSQYVAQKYIKNMMKRRETKENMKVRAWLSMRARQGWKDIEAKEKAKKEEEEIIKKALWH